jgi:DNA-binding protein Fis
VIEEMSATRDFPGMRRSDEAAAPGRTDGDAADALAAAAVAQLVRQLLHSGQPGIYRRVALAIDRVLLDEVLHFSRGNQVHASDLLGISRTTLRTKLRALGMGLGAHLVPESDSSLSPP